MEKQLFMKSAELHVRTMGVCSVSAWGSFHSAHFLPLHSQIGPHDSSTKASLSVKISSFTLIEKPMPNSTVS